MSTLELDTDKGKFNNYIRDVMFLYVWVARYTANYNKDGYQYETVCVVDEDTADSFKENFPKSSVIKVKTVLFKDKHKVDPPYPDEKNQWLIKVTGDSHYKSGEVVPTKNRPKVFVPDGAKVKNITNETLIANGSKGDLSFRVFVKEGFGSFPKLKGLLVTDLIEYIPKEQGGDFGEVSNAAEAEVQAEAKAAEQEAYAKKAQATPQESTPQEQAEEPSPEQDNDDPF